MRADDPQRYRVTVCAQGDQEVSAQLFFDHEQFAEVIGTDGRAEVMFFGPSQEEPPALDLELTVDLLRGAARRL